MSEQPEAGPYRVQKPVTRTRPYVAGPNFAQHLPVDLAEYAQNLNAAYAAGLARGQEIRRPTVEYECWRCGIVIKRIQVEP